MLSNIFGQIKRACVISTVTYLILAIISNDGIDHYLIEDYIFDDSIQILFIMIGIVLAYKMVEYAYKAIETKIKNDIRTIKTEIETKKIAG